MHDVQRDHVVLLLQRRVRDAWHHRELLVGVGQRFEEVQQVVEAGDAVVFAAHDDGRHHDLRRVDHRQVVAHVDVGAVRDRIVECQDMIGERFDDVVVCGAGMVTLEDRADELAVDRPPLGLEIFGQLLAALDQRRAAFAGPDVRVEREPLDAVGMALREQGGAQRAGRDAVHQQRAGVVAGLEDVVGAGLQIVGAFGDRASMPRSLVERP